jgi:PRTRC genetic system ParB family protein
MQLTLPISRIVQGKNPREYFDPDEMAELEEGIRAFGVIEPIIVRPVPDSDLLEIIAGERRWRAAKNVFGDSYDMPVVVREASDADSEAIALIENYHRAGMSVAEEARTAQRQLLRNRGDKQETARNLGWSPDVLERRLALMACTPAVLKALTQRQIREGHAELLAGVPPEKQDTVLSAIVAHKVPVVVLKSQLGQYVRRLADAIFDTAPCTGCPHNSARQAGLFSESLGDGYCQHPTHFDELTLQAVVARAAALKDEYPVIRIVKLTDGFTPLTVSAEGALGVGDDQYVSCRGCQSFGCAVSAMPGSYGEVTRSLCFDAGCNSQKVAAWRKAQRDAGPKPEPLGGTSRKKSGAHKSGKHTHEPARRAVATEPSNQTPQRVVDHRIAQWRRWAANALMTQPERNHRVLIALALAGRGSDLRSEQLGKVIEKLAASGGLRHSDLGGHLRRADAIGADQLAKLVQAVAASAAFGVDTRNLELLLNYLEIDESRHFLLDKTFLDLFTMSELESLAGEIGLKRAMGQGFRTARAAKKAEFIAALLAVKGFEYRGTVPQVMRYPRHAVTGAASDEQEMPQETTEDGAADAPSDDETQALAA